MRALEHRPDDRIGHAAAVFAVVVGAPAGVASGCMTVAVYGWPHVPGWYIT